jgi:hypothetical protein
LGEPEGGNGGGEGGGHGFLSEEWEQRLEGGLLGMGHVGEGATALDLANKGSGALRTAQAFAPFEGGLMNVIRNNPMELLKSGSELAEHGGGFLGGASKALGPLGSIMGGIQAGTDGVLAANDIAKEGWDNGKGGGAYHDQKFYNHVGGSALGAAHAVLPWLGPYGAAADLALTGGELAANYGGKAAGWAFGDKAKFSADSVAGGLIRGTFGDQSAGEQVRQGVGNVLGHGTAANVVGWGADVATNAAMFPAQLGATVGRGLWNEGSAIVSSIANGEGAVGGALNHAGHAVANGVSSAAHWAGDTASSLGRGALNAGSSALNWAGNTASNLGHSALNAGSSALNWAGNTASNIGNTASNLGHSALNAGSSALHSVADAGSSAIHAITSW